MTDKKTHQTEIPVIVNAEVVNSPSRLLTAGKLQILFENGCIRSIRLGNVEIIRMIYIAVRDHNWGTLTPTIENLNLQQEKDHFSLTYTMHFGNPWVFEANCSITGFSDNTISFKFKGQMVSDFASNRIGFCILHPIEECKGQTCIITHVDGAKETGHFPNSISPHQPFRNIKSIHWEPQGIQAALTFTGDVFEMEDQRNWTDASFKTYCTPLDRPFPVSRKKGSLIEQSVLLTAQQTLPKFLEKCAEDECVHIEILQGNSHAIPSIGCWYNPVNGVLTDSLVDQLKNTGISHVRFDINFLEKNWRQQLNQFIHDWRKLETGIEISFHIGPRDYANYIQAIKMMEEIAGHIRFIQFFSTESKSTLIPGIEEYIDLCRDVYPHTTIGAGTDYDFTEINRSRFDAGPVDYIVYSICPQVHASDDLSIIENLAAQKDTVESAGNIYPGKSIHVSVISLLRRSNPDATDNQDFPSEKYFDDRQYTIFTAQWGLASLKQLIEAGTNLITQFELIGERGLLRALKNDSGTRTRTMRSAYSYVLEILHTYRPTKLIPVKSSNPLIIEAVLFRNDHAYLLILINFSGKNQVVSTGQIFMFKSSYVLDQNTLQQCDSDGHFTADFSSYDGQSVDNNRVVVKAQSIMFLLS